MIKTVDTSTLRNNMADVVREVTLKKDYVLVTRKSRPMAAVVNLDFLEDLLALSSPSYLDSIRKARRDWKSGKVSSHEDVFGRIG